MDTGSIVTIVGIILLIVINVASVFITFGKITQRVRACEKTLFDDGLVEKVNACKVSIARVETKQDALLERLKGKISSDRLP